MLKDVAKKLPIHEATICHKGHHFAINYKQLNSPCNTKENAKRGSSVLSNMRLLARQGCP